MSKGKKQFQEPTIGDVLAAINSFASDIESELSSIKVRHSLDILEIKSALSKVNTRLNTLPTKDYIDEKLSDLRGDIVIGQKLNNKAVALVVKSLERKKVFQANEAKAILKLVER